MHSIRVSGQKPNLREWVATCVILISKVTVPAKSYFGKMSNVSPVIKNGDVEFISRGMAEVAVYTEIRLR